MNGKILHIEDDENICLMVKEILGNKGFDCSYVLKAETALKLLKEKNYDLILLDLKLESKMQGEDFLKELKKLKIKTKVIPLTASPETIKQELKKEYPEYIIDIILKPFASQELVKKIENALKQ